MRLQQHASKDYKNSIINLSGSKGLVHAHTHSDCYQHRIHLSHLTLAFRSGIYFHTPEQKAAAEASRAAWNEKLGGAVVTEIEELRNFNMAEDYHQQYLEKGGQSARKSCNDPIRCYG